MTETLQRSSGSSMPPRGPEPVPARRRSVAGGLAALLVVALGLLLVGAPVLLVWAAEARAGASAAEALRAAGQLWLVVHGVTLELPDGRLSLAPLGLLALPLWLLWRAGGAVSRACRSTSVRSAAQGALAVAVPYAALATGVAMAAAGAEVRPSPGSAAVHGLAVGLLGAGAGALGRDRLWRAAWLRLGERARRTLPAAAAASGVLAAGGALLAGTSLAVHADRAAELAGSTAPGAVGGATLLLLGISLVPNAVVWAASWLAGPGFAVGVGTTVGPFGHEVGPLPALPLLAALPGSAVPGWAGAVALLVPLGAGALAGRVLWRRADRAASTARALADAAAAGAACGAGWAVLAWLSGGAAGGARLSAVGPSGWAVGAAVAAEVAVGAAVAGLVLRRRG